MLNKVLFHQFPNLKSWLTRLQYEFLSSLNMKKDVMFMNFGYNAHHQGHEPLPLDADDEQHRYPIQLYHHEAKPINRKCRDRYQSSSARGDGGSFLSVHCNPKSLRG